MPRATSIAMYMGSAKKQSVKNANGMNELIVPSSTTCVEMIAFATSVQKTAETAPACKAVKTTSGVLPCARNDPVVMSCKARVRKYRPRNADISRRPKCAQNKTK